MNSKDDKDNKPADGGTLNDTDKTYDESVNELADEINRIMKEEHIAKDETETAKDDALLQTDSEAARTPINDDDISSALEEMADATASAERADSDDDNTEFIDTEAINARVNGSESTVSEDTFENSTPNEEAAKSDAKLFNETDPAAENSNDEDLNSDGEDETSGGHGKLWRKVLLIVCGAIAAVYVAGFIFFSFFFGPYTVINNTDCSYKSVGAVESIIASQVDAYKLTIEERGGKTETLSGSDIGLTYVNDGQVKKLLRAQNAFIWPVRFFLKDSVTKTETHASVTMDENKFSEIVNSLACMDSSKMVAPADAYPELKGSTYSIHSEELGTTIITDTFISSVKEAVLNTVTALDLDAAGCYTNPTVTSKTPELISTVDTINKYISLTITYHLGDTTEVLDGSITDSWFTWDENLSPTISQDAVTAWVADFAARHNTVGATRTFTSVNGSECTVTGGTYGWKLDQQAEIDSINQMYADMTSQDREPYWAKTAATFGATDWGNTYVELDLTNQHVYYIQDGTSVFDCDVVTGLPTPAKQTPSGVWYILEKQQNKTLRGDRQTDGSYEYETPVSYWLRMTWTGVGFHDASWQPRFGGDRYTYAGSHGCINMSYSTVQEMYSLVDVGCPVVSHY